MKDVIGQIYNGFLLRDFLGYLVPGGFVLACLVQMTASLAGADIQQLGQFVLSNSIALWIIVFSLCYACGHFLSGLFFHFSVFRPIFAYFPKELLRDYADMSRDEAWAAHRTQYIEARRAVGDTFQGHIERHAALLHFTGHFSAGLLFTISYILTAPWFLETAPTRLLALPLAILLPGIFLHYRRLSIERYRLERSVIGAAEKTQTPLPALKVRSSRSRKSQPVEAV